MKRFVVSGAHGFVGNALCVELRRRGYPVTGLVRRRAPLPAGVAPWIVDDFTRVAQAWAAGGPAVDCLIHLAARVHVMHEKSSDPLAAYRASNLDGTLRLAEAAANNGVRRFVFLSSIKALGDSDRGVPWREDDPPLVLDAYGASKREAEQALLALARNTGMDVVIVRPPLVYGPGVRANFLRLLGAAARQMPLPLGRVTAPRSLVSVHNLADALIRCALHDAAPGRIYHVTDGIDLTTVQLVTTLGRLFNKPARLLPVPPILLRWAGLLVGRSAEIQRLISPMRVDCSRICNELDWQAPYSVEQELLETVTWYRSTHQ